MSAAQTLTNVVRILDGGFDAAIIVDTDRRLVYANQRYASLCGIDESVLARRIDEGQRCFEQLRLSLCNSECLGCAALANDAACQANATVEVTGRALPGRELAVAAVPLGDGYVVELLREPEAAQRQSQYESIAALVHEEKMSGLSRLVAGVAHELNNPINFIYGNVDFLGDYMDKLISVVEMIGKESLPNDVRARLDLRLNSIEFEFLLEDSRKLVRSIRSGAERTAGIVRDLKAFSRVSGRSQPTDIVSGIETTLNLLRPLLKGRIEIEREYEPDLPQPNCHSGQINQVLMHLLTNAIQAIDGKGRVLISVRAVEGELHVAVCDNGAGIDESVMKRLGDPFFTTRAVGEGTGLGLWVCNNIVRAHGGQLTHSNNPHGGATATLILPVGERAPAT